MRLGGGETQRSATFILFLTTRRSRVGLRGHVRMRAHSRVRRCHVFVSVSGELAKNFQYFFNRITKTIKVEKPASSRGVCVGRFALHSPRLVFFGIIRSRSVARSLAAKSRVSPYSRGVVFAFFFFSPGLRGARKRERDFAFSPCLERSLAPPPRSSTRILFFYRRDDARCVFENRSPNSGNSSTRTFVDRGDL